MFPKNSAFTPDDDQQAYLEDIRQRALGAVNLAKENTPQKKTASHLLEDAAELIEAKEFEQAIELIHEAREIYEP